MNPSLRLGPTARSSILTVMGILSGLAIVLVAVFSLRAPEATAAALAARSVPAETALQSTLTDATTGQTAFLTAFSAKSAMVRAAELNAAEVSSNREHAAWDAYQALAGDRGNEPRLQASFEKSERSAGELAAVVVASIAAGTPSTASVAAEVAQSNNVLLALNTIESTIYAPLIKEQAAAVRLGIGTARHDVTWFYAILAVLFCVGGGLLMKGARRDQKSMTTEADALRLASKRGDFEASLQRGLEMAPTEHATFGILEQALTMVVDHVPADLLLADSSRAHFEKALGTPGHTEGACDVTSPIDCPACTSGQARLFEDNTLLDTCRFLRGRERVATICVPVSIAGQTIGVIRAQSPFGSHSPANLVNELTLVARKAGERIGAQRVLAQTEEQAQSDPLTGLPNRRTFENQVDQLHLRNTPYVIAFADLDRFKLINDIHGHDVGDRALRVFAQVLRDAIRPGDLLARHGGEEFVVLLPNCSLPDARNVAERVRSQLARAVGHGSVPPFTVTIGLAKAGPNAPLSDVIATADAAMSMAKSLGRDRVFTANDVPLRDSDPPGVTPPELDAQAPSRPQASTAIERSRGVA